MDSLKPEPAPEQKYFDYRCGSQHGALGMLSCVMPEHHTGAHVSHKGVNWSIYRGHDGVDYVRTDFPPGVTAYDLFTQDTLDVISTTSGEVLANANYYRQRSADLLLLVEVNGRTWDVGRIREATGRAQVWAMLAISAAADGRRHAEDLSDVAEP